MKNLVNKTRIKNFIIGLLFLGIYSCSNKNLDSGISVNQKLNSNKTYLFRGDGFYYVKKDTTGKFKGYFEYGSFNTGNYCNAYLESTSETNKVVYGLFDNLDTNHNLITDPTMARGKIILKDSSIIVHGGGSARCALLVDYNDDLEYKLVESTEDKFLIISKDKPEILDLNSIPIEDASLYSGMLVRCVGEQNNYYKVEINTADYFWKRSTPIYLLKKEDCSIW